MTRTNGIHPFAIEDPDAAPSTRTGLPVVVIGAGPVGLAAAHLLDRGLEPLVLEAGPRVGPVRLTETIFAGDRNRLVYELGDLDALYERDQ